jgi:cytosine/adenosine deaminase-related metal-dependent hydrolase
MRQIYAKTALLPDGLAKDVAIEVNDAGVICKVTPDRPGEGTQVSGLVLPGLINAHLHLEFSWFEAPVGGGDGFVPWIETVHTAQKEQPSPAARLELAGRAARRLYAEGTAAVADIAGELHTAALLVDAGLQGVVEREFLGLSRTHQEELLARCDQFLVTDDAGVVHRPAAHAPYSTSPEVIRRALGRQARCPGAIHLAEDEGELDFLARGEGPFAALLNELGIDWGWWEPPACEPVTYLEQCDALGPGTLAVHCVHVSAAGLEKLAETQTPVCLCPRSNLHIGGRLPPVREMIQAGVRLCVGTDSLASSPSLDVLDEIPVLAHHFPEVPTETWLQLVTAGGADCLGLNTFGQIAPGFAPGLLWLRDCAHADALRDRCETRRSWLIEPGRQG